MRLYKDKVLSIIDFVDDLSYKDDLNEIHDNYIMKHMKERIKIYKAEKYPYNVIDVDLTKDSEKSKKQ
jgi:hypothetical protein